MSVFGSELAHDLLLEFCSKFDLDPVEALEELDSIECHCDEVFGRERVQILWVVKVDLQPNEVLAEVDDVPVEVCDGVLQLYHLSIFLHPHLEGVEE